MDYLDDRDHQEELAVALEYEREPMGRTRPRTRANGPLAQYVASMAETTRYSQSGAGILAWISARQEQVALLLSVSS